MEILQEANTLQASIAALHTCIQLNPDQKRKMLTQWINEEVPSLGLDVVLCFQFYNIAMTRDEMPSNTINNYGSVGNLNFGQQYGAVSAIINNMSSSPEKETVAESFRNLLEAIRASSELHDDQKTEIVQAVGELASTAETGKKTIGTKALLDWLPTTLKLAPTLLDAWHKFSPAIITHLHALGM